MNVLALCAGIGGLELGIKIASPESRTVCYVEGEAYASSILINQMERGNLDSAPIWSNVRTFDCRAWRGLVDCISGGYPCQPFSQAGLRKGTDDERHLWPHFRRIIGELKPRRVFFENVPGHLSLGFEEVLSDLRGLGYRVEAGLFSASEVGLPQLRKRLFIMGDSEHAGLYADRKESRSDREDLFNSPQGESQAEQPSGTSSEDLVHMADSDSEDGIIINRPEQQISGLGESALSSFGGRPQMWPPTPNDTDRWKRVIEGSPGLAPAIPKSLLRGVANGNAVRVDQLRALGNAVVPLVAAHAWNTLSNRLERQGGI